MKSVNDNHNPICFYHFKPEVWQLIYNLLIRLKCELYSAIAPICLIQEPRLFADSSCPYTNSAI